MGRCSAPPNLLDPLGHGAEERLDRGLEVVDLPLGLMELHQDVTDRAVQVTNGEVQRAHSLMELRDGLGQVRVLLIQFFLMLT